MAKKMDTLRYMICIRPDSGKIHCVFQKCLFKLYIFSKNTSIEQTIHMYAYSQHFSSNPNKIGENMLLQPSHEYILSHLSLCSRSGFNLTSPFDNVQ